MALRDRQIGGIPLGWGQAIVLTFLCAGCIPVIAYNFWFPFFGIPEEFRIWIVCVSVCLYLGRCAGNVKTGTEQPQLFWGKFTGISFPAGFYLLPRIPSPFIELFIYLAFKVDVSRHLGWVLEGSVSVTSIVVQFFSQGLTKDRMRATLAGTLVFEIESAAIFASQTPDERSYANLQIAVQAESSARIKQRVIAKHTTQELMEGEYEDAAALTSWITEECAIIKDFGVRLSRVVAVTVKIESEQMERMFDMDIGSAILRRVTNEAAEAFKDYYDRLGSGADMDIALQSFNAIRSAQGLPTVTMNMVKLK